MPRDLPIGNGTLLAAFDFDYQIRDFYYPRVGKENHALGYPWRFGVWLEGEFSWLGRGSWALHRDYIADTLVTSVSATHPRFPNASSSHKGARESVPSDGAVGERTSDTTPDGILSWHPAYAIPDRR